MRILIVDDEPTIRRMMCLCLEDAGHDVSPASSRDEALGLLERKLFDLVFVDLRLGSQSGYDIVSHIHARFAWTRTVVITAFSSIESAVKAVKLGATDYMPKPFSPEQMLGIVSRINEQIRAQPAGSKDGGDNAEDIELSESEEMQRLLVMARQVAPTDASALILGENGTGKSLLAKKLHQWSSRAEKSFVTISCPSLSAELLESDLFGHLKGSFTGAIKDHPGKVAEAEGGTLFLDEIGTLPASIQPKLLRFLQDREYNRVGDVTTSRADVRFVAATNHDLLADVAHGSFREDLYYRINVVTLRLPSLRERKEDIIPLAERFLAIFTARYDRTRSLSEASRAALLSYPWPGNVRELRNVVERACILCSGTVIEPENLNLVPSNVARKATEEAPAPESLSTIEIEHIRKVLASTTSMQDAARILGIDATTLWRKRKKHGL